MNMFGKLKILILVLTTPLFASLPVYATPGSASSPNYSVNQVFFGAGGSNSQTDGTLNAQVAVGETGVGNYSSPNYQAYAGFNTTAEPFLEAVVTGTNLNLGILSRLSTATANATFYVRAWDSSGYIVQTVAPPPTNSSYTFATNSTPAANSVGSEQFGMNLRANTSPITYGADPVQSTAYSYGVAFGNYATANQYAYNNGDTIAKATQSTSSTVYTISYVFNIGPATPGGIYTFNQNLVITGYY